MLPSCGGTHVWDLLKKIVGNDAEPPPPDEIRSVRFDIYMNTHDEVDVPISPIDILATLIVKSVAEPTIVLLLRPRTVVSKLPTVT
jgi:hypothetical protein